MAEKEMVANFLIRPGDIYTSNNFKAFLKKHCHFLKIKRLVFCVHIQYFITKIFTFLEDEKSIDYKVATPMYHSVQKSIFAQKKHGLKSQMEFEYKGKNWKRASRMVAVRQKISKRPKAVSKWNSNREKG